MFDAWFAISSVSTDIFDFDKYQIKSCIASSSFLFRSISMKSASHCLAYLDKWRPESLRPGLSGFRMSAAKSVRRLTISCSFDGMYPLDNARYIW